MLTGAPGFPGADRGGMLGLLPGGGGVAAAGWSGHGGAGAAGAAVAGVVLSTGDLFKRLSASLYKTKNTGKVPFTWEEDKAHQQLEELTEEMKCSSTQAVGNLTAMFSHFDASLRINDSCAEGNSIKYTQI